MTAPQPAAPGSDSVRTQIAEALRDNAHICGHHPCSSCLIISDEDFAATIWATTVHEHQVTEVQADVVAIADVLLPLVDRLRAEAKAEALMAAVDEIEDDLDVGINPSARFVAAGLRDRAAAYRINPSSEETHRG